MRFIGLDVHHLYIEIAELTDGGVMTHSCEPLTPNGLEALKKRLGDDADVVLEAGTSSSKLYDELRPYARSVVVAHPAQTRGASPRHVKTDLRDAGVSAKLLATGFVHPVWVPPANCRALRSLIEFRSTLRTLHTMCVNQVYACFRSELLEYPETLCSQKMEVAGTMAWSEPHLGQKVQSLLAVKTSLRKELSNIDKALGEWCADSADATLIRTIPGVGVVLAATILSEIGDVHRFPDSKQLCAYAGLVPKVQSSGKTLHIGKLAKGGRHLLRGALWMATLSLVRRDKHFKELYDGLCCRRPKKVALVACSRKLLAVMWQMLRSGQPFRHQPYRERATTSKNRKQQPANEVAVASQQGVLSN
jgi:transposase